MRKVLAIVICVAMGASSGVAHGRMFDDWAPDGRISSGNSGFHADRPLAPLGGPGGQMSGAGNSVYQSNLAVEGRVEAILRPEQSDSGRPRAALGYVHATREEGVFTVAENVSTMPTAMQSAIMSYAMDVINDPNSSAGQRGRAEEIRSLVTAAQSGRDPGHIGGNITLQVRVEGINSGSPTFEVIGVSEIRAGNSLGASAPVAQVQAPVRPQVQPQNSVPAPQAPPQGPQAQPPAPQPQAPQQQGPQPNGGPVDPNAPQNLPRTQLVTPANPMEFISNNVNDAGFVQAMAGQRPALQSQVAALINANPQTGDRSVNVSTLVELMRSDPKNFSQNVQTLVSLSAGGLRMNDVLSMAVVRGSATELIANTAKVAAHIGTAPMAELLSWSPSNGATADFKINRINRAAEELPASIPHVRATLLKV